MSLELNQIRTHAQGRTDVNPAIRQCRSSTEGSENQGEGKDLNGQAKDKNRGNKTGHTGGAPGDGGGQKIEARMLDL